MYNFMYGMEFSSILYVICVASERIKKINVKCLILVKEVQIQLGE